MTRDPRTLVLAGLWAVLCPAWAGPDAEPGDGDLLRGDFAAEEMLLETAFGTIPVATRVIDRVVGLGS